MCVPRLLPIIAAANTGVAVVAGVSGLRPHLPVARNDLPHLVERSACPGRAHSHVSASLRRMTSGPPNQRTGGPAGHLVHIEYPGIASLAKFRSRWHASENRSRNGAQPVHWPASVPCHTTGGSGYDGVEWPHSGGLNWPHCDRGVGGGILVSA
jgi:hypothetical protein